MNGNAIAFNIFYGPDIKVICFHRMTPFFFAVLSICNSRGKINIKRMQFAQKHISRLVTFPLIMDVTTSQKEILTFVYMAGPEPRWLNITS